MMKKDTGIGIVKKTYEVPFYPEEEQQLSHALQMSLSKSEQEVLEDLMHSRIKKCREEGTKGFDQPSSRLCLSFRVNETASSASIVKAEFEQELYDEYTSGENWTEFTLMHAFRITEDIFEQNRQGIDYIDSGFKKRLWPFHEDAFCAADEYLRANEKMDTIVYDDSSVRDISSKWTETIWWEVYNIYVKDLATIPGYIHIFYAIGVTEFHTDHH